jgi:hypothetical protein
MPHVHKVASLRHRVEVRADEDRLSGRFVGQAQNEIPSDSAFGDEPGLARMVLDDHHGSLLAFAVARTGDPHAVERRGTNFIEEPLRDAGELLEIEHRCRVHLAPPLAWGKAPVPPSRGSAAE